MNKTEIIAQLKQHEKILKKTVLISFVLASLILLGYANSYTYLHEFGHSAAATALALAYHNPGLNITWVYGEKGPVQTKITTKMNGALWPIFSLGGGLFEILLTYGAYFILRRPKIKVLLSLRNWSANAFLVCFVFYAIFVSMIFADTDGFALGPLMREQLGTVWAITSQTILFMLLLIGTASMTIAMALDLVPFFTKKE